MVPTWIYFPDGRSQLITHERDLVNLSGYAETPAGPFNHRAPDVDVAQIASNAVIATLPPEATVVEPSGDEPEAPVPVRRRGRPRKVQE